MNIDHTSMTAKLRASVRGLGASGMTVQMAALARGARRAGVVCMLACTTLVAFAPVQAQDRGGFRKDDLQQQRQDDRGNRGDRGDRDAQRQDGQRYDDARRQQQDHNEAQRRSGRLTPDERRDLRRQINEAGIDLYPNTPPRR